MAHYEYETEPASRPSFLTWLCILTFIGSGWAIASSAYTYVSAGRYANILSPGKPPRRDSLYTDSARAIHGERRVFAERIRASLRKILDKDNLRRLAVGNLLAALFTLSGALMMWRLKRVGFYLYVTGVVIGIAVPFVLFGNDMIAVGATAFNNFFGLIFIALYALNFKSLNSKGT